jgi:hypothetical protein
MRYSLQILAAPILFVSSALTPAVAGTGEAPTPAWMRDTYSPGLSAQDEDPSAKARAFAEDFRLSAGGQLVTSISTAIRVDANGIGGSELSLEDNFGFKTEVNVLRLDAAWRMSGRHSLIASYYDISRSSSKTGDFDFTFNGVDYDGNYTIESFFDTQTYKLAYGYSFLEEESYALAASAGFHVMSLSTGLDVNGAGVSKASVTAPLPVVGLHGGYRFADNWRLGAAAEVFGIKIDTFSGTLIDTVVKLEYEVASYAALGLGYNYFDMNLTLAGDKFTGKANFGYTGLLFFLRGGF